VATATTAASAASEQVVATKLETITDIDEA